MSVLIKNIPEDSAQKALFDEILTEENGFVRTFEGPVVRFGEIGKERPKKLEKELLIMFKGFDVHQLNGWTRLFGAARGAMGLYGSVYTVEGFNFSQFAVGNLTDFKTLYQSVVENPNMVTIEKIHQMISNSDKINGDGLEALAILMPVMPMPWQTLLQGSRLASRAVGSAA